MPEEEKILLLKYLKDSDSFSFQETQRRSTLVAGLNDCRKCTNRNRNGVYDSEIKHGNPGSWLGSIGYFTILDQLGSCFKPAFEAEPSQHVNSIKYAIEKFGYDLIECNEHELNALIALRNAFTHDFNLLNTPTTHNEHIRHLQVHKFTVTCETNDSWIVRLPTRVWDENIASKNFNDTSDSTFVNLFGFGQLVEEIYSRICTLAQSNSLETRIPLNILINKYTFVTSTHPSVQ